MIRFSFNIGCTESKVIFKWGEKKKQTNKKEGANVRTSYISFGLSQNSQWQTNTVYTQNSPP